MKMSQARRCKAHRFQALALLALCLAMACADPAVAAAPRLTPTRDGVRWSGAAVSGVATAGGAPLAAWWRAARDSGLVGTAVLCPLADLLAARGDTTRADSLLAVPRLAVSPWAWEAIRRRAGLVLAHENTRRAGQLLDSVDRKLWPASEEAAWRASRAPILVATRDTIGGEALARSVLENFVAVVPASAQALALLDSLARVRREPFSRGFA